MAIESDVYVKLGDDIDEYPLIEGDCTDDTHYWWCELRSCGFNLSVPDHSKLEGDDAGGGSDSGSGSSPPKKPKTKWDKVSMKKRIDWASTRLFLRCCEAGRRKIDKAKATADDQDPSINVVTVHVCKTAGGRKFPFVVIWYYGVRITDYKVDMSGPEPEETIEIEFDSYEFGYQPTDPTTGLPDGYPMVKSGHIERDEDPTHDEEAGTEPGGSSTAAAAAAAATGGAAAGAAAAPASANAGTALGVSTATEIAVTTNFPGFSQGTGSGILPD